MEIRLANYKNLEDQSSIKTLLNVYSRDPMGNGNSLSESILTKVVSDLQSFPGAFTILAFDEGQVVGLANCFTTYSTFKAAPLVNIHDIAVVPNQRGKKIGEKMIQKVTEEAQKRGCCKITLEVRNDNKAKHLYLRMGFKDGEPPMEFMTKEL